MENIKINYVIATCNAITKSRRYNYSEKVLDFQLEKLREILDNKKKNNIECLIKKITIIVNDVSLSDTKYFKNYYLFDKWKSLFTDLEINFQMYTGNNLHFSYDQWLQGILTSAQNFTHHIIIEDDYCIDPDCLDFDIQLVTIYKDKFKDNIGYLSEKCGNDSSFGYHSWISNGIISTDTIKKLNDPLKLFYSYNMYPQITFSYLFRDNNIPLADYSDYFKVTFWNQIENKIIDFTENKELKNECFVPVEKFLF